MSGLLLALAAIPAVALFPEPPAFGRPAVAIAATVLTLATMGTSLWATRVRRVRIRRRAALAFSTTAAATVLHIVLVHAGVPDLPTIDLLPRLFGLEGEDITDAVLFEAWAELWLLCGVAVLLLAAAGRRGRQPVVPEPAVPPWNAATVLLWLVGWGVLAGAVLDGHWTAAFLAGAEHVSGTIADADDHPHIRFTDGAGAVVVFRQNGFVSRPVGAAVPVAYDTRDPAGTARADTFWANWSDVLGMLWIGLGFTLFPFFGFRAAFRAGRW